MSSPKKPRLGLHCPKCRLQEWKVIDSRPVGAGVMRRRRCLKCRAVLKTIERQV